MTCLLVNSPVESILWYWGKISFILFWALVAILVARLLLSFRKARLGDGVFGVKSTVDKQRSTFVGAFDKFLSYLTNTELARQAGRHSSGKPLAERPLGD
jgi:hypothetical protein